MKDKDLVIRSLLANHVEPKDSMYMIINLLATRPARFKCDEGSQAPMPRANWMQGHQHTFCYR